MPTPDPTPDHLGAPPALADPAQRVSIQLLSERKRALVALLITVLAALVLIFLNGNEEHLTYSDAAVIVLLAYLMSYLVVTVVAFSRASSDVIREWADREDRGSVMERYVLGTAPGPGSSLFVSTVALIVALFWMPGHGTTLPDAPRLAVAILLIVCGWCTVLVSYAVTYFADNLVEDEKALDFPNTPRAEWSDYIYFSLAVMTTFGATDVSVTSSIMRRTVSGAAVIAFVFNTVTVAAAVGAITG